MSLNEYLIMIEKCIRLNTFFQYQHTNPFVFPVSRAILEDLKAQEYDNLSVLSDVLTEDEQALVDKVLKEFDEWFHMDMDACFQKIVESKHFKEEWKQLSVEQQRLCIYSDPRWYHYARQQLSIEHFHAVLHPEDMVYGLHHVPLLYPYLTAKTVKDFFQGKREAMDTPYEQFWLEIMRHKPTAPSYEERLHIVSSAIVDNEWYTHVSWLDWFEITPDNYDPSSTYQRLTHVFARIHPLIMIEKELEPLQKPSFGF